MSNTMSPEDFKFYQNLLLEKSGLSLSEDKAYLLSTRLSPVALSFGYAALEGFTKDLKVKNDATLLRSVIEAMTTNETSFFRDTKPFVSLKELLPGLMETKGFSKKIRILSAACSSGQESYSIAITLDEFLKDHPGWSFEIVGTDISYDILEKAKEGDTVKRYPLLFI